MINWQSFTWEAFATLITGVSAVCAATTVALRQAKIADRQVRLQELAVRDQMFMIRIDRVYDPVINALVEYSDETKPPREDTVSRLGLARRWAQFTFDEKICDGISALLADVISLEFDINSLNSEVDDADRRQREAEIMRKRMSIFLSYGQLINDLTVALQLPEAP